MLRTCANWRNTSITWASLANRLNPRAAMYKEGASLLTT
jgi:hypothetical protein